MKRSDASHKSDTHGRRLAFDVFELLEAAGGFNREDGYVVMPKEIADQVKGELERLYRVQDTAVLVCEYINEHYPDLPPERSGLVSLLGTIKRETAV